MKIFLDQTDKNLKHWELVRDIKNLFCKNCKKKSYLHKPVQYSGYKKWLVAAGIALLFGLIFQTGRMLQQNKTENSPVRQNEQYFSMIIKEKLQEVEKEKSPETEKIFNEAMKQIKLLETDYQFLVKDYKENKNKNILNAMIENFQQRIDILYLLKKQIEEIKENKKYQNEKYKV